MFSLILTYRNLAFCAQHIHHRVNTLSLQGMSRSGSKSPAPSYKDSYLVNVEIVYKNHSKRLLVSMTPFTILNQHLQCYKYVYRAHMNKTTPLLFNRILYLLEFIQFQFSGSHIILNY